MHRLKQLDLCRPGGALAAVLLVRVAWGVWAAFISSLLPENALEKAVAVWPAQVFNGQWWQRVAVSPWMRHDWEYYERIVWPGYRTDDGTSSFHPLYPTLAKGVFQVTHNANASLLLVATLSAWASTLLIARYARRFHARPGDEKFPTVASWFFLLNPLGWVVLAPYTEGTFLAFSIASLWAIRERRFWLGALLGAGATLTRQQGVLLLLPLLWYLWRPAPDDEPRTQVLAGAAQPHKHAPLSDWLCLLLIPLAYASFSLYRVLIVGEAPDEGRGVVAYLASWIVSPSTRLVVPDSGLAAPWKPLLVTFKMLPVTPYPIHLLTDAVGGWGVVALIVASWKKMAPSEKMWCLGVAVAATFFFSGPYIGFPRHTMLAFPVPILVARWARERGRERIVLEVMLLFNLLLCAGFVRHSFVP